MISHWIALVRPINVVILIVSVYAGGVFCFDGYFSIKLLIASIAAGLILAYGNIINDIFDIDLDRQSKKHKPLPSNRISVASAKIFGVLLAFVGVAIASIVSPYCGLLAVGNVILLGIYTPLFKGRGYLGNILIALICASTFPFAGLAVGNISGSLFPAIFAFTINLMREIVKDIQDYEDDKNFGIQTGAVRYGIELSKSLSTMIGLVLMLLTFLPYLLNVYGKLYLTAVMLLVDFPLAIIISKLPKASSKSDFRILSGALKLLMLMGLVALLIGSKWH